VNSMAPHLIILLIVFPLQFGLGWWNNKRQWLDSGEVGFWSMIIFLVVEMVYLGAIR